MAMTLTVNRGQISATNDTIHATQIQIPTTTITIVPTSLLHTSTCLHHRNNTVAQARAPHLHIALHRSQRLRHQAAPRPATSNSPRLPPQPSIHPLHPENSSSLTSMEHWSSAHPVLKAKQHTTPPNVPLRARYTHVRIWESSGSGCSTRRTGSG